jgi:hypothetical protein
VFVDHSLHEFSSAAVNFDKATEQPLYQFRQAYPQDGFGTPEMGDCTLGTHVRVCHCSGERWFPKRLLFGRGIRWGSRSVYQPDNKGDLATTWVTIMVMEDGGVVLRRQNACRGRWPCASYPPTGDSCTCCPARTPNEHDPRREG